MKVDSPVCSVMGLNKRKYLPNSSLGLLIPCAIVFIRNEIEKGTA